MMEFENYRWQDHVPRAGSWKLNLAVAVIAVGLIAASLPDDSVERAHFSAGSATQVNLSAFDSRHRTVPASVPPADTKPTQCVTGYAES